MRHPFRTLSPRLKVALAIAALLLGAAVQRQIWQMDERFFQGSLPGIRGLALYAIGDYSGAARAYRDHLREASRAAGPSGDDGWSALLSGDYQSAKAISKKAVEKNPVDISALLTLADVALHEKAYGEALELSARVLTRERDQYDALLLSSVAHAHSGAYGSAIDSLNRAMRHRRTESRITSFLWALETAGSLGDNPNGERPFCLLAQYYRYFRIFDDSNARPAIRYANRAIASGDHPPDAYVTLGVISYKTGRRQEALSHFLKAVEVNPKHALAHRWAALIYSDQGDLANEYQALNAADEIAPGDPFHALDLDHFLIHKSGDYRRALDRTLKRLGDTPPDSKDVWTAASLYRSLGEQEEAVRYYQSAIQLQPRNPSLYEEMAFSLRELGQSNEAIAAYQQAISIAPYRPTPHAGLGFTFHKDARYLEAVGEFEQALRYGDRSIGTHAGLCSLYHQTGAFERALECFQHLLARDPKNRTAANLLPYVMTNLRRERSK